MPATTIHFFATTDTGNQPYRSSFPAAEAVASRSTAADLLGHRLAAAVLENAPEGTTVQPRIGVGVWEGAFEVSGHAVAHYPDVPARAAAVRTAQEWCIRHGQDAVLVFVEGEGPHALRQLPEHALTPRAGTFDVGDACWDVLVNWTPRDVARRSRRGTAYFVGPVVTFPLVPAVL